MKNPLPLLLGILLLGATSSVFAHANGEYGKPATFKINHWINYPDLQIRYLGDRHVEAPIKSGFHYYDFEVRVGDKTQQIAWSSGTGEIAPVFFTIGGKDFALELKATISAKGFMKENQLVLWPKDAFLKAANQRTSH